MYVFIHKVFRGKIWKSYLKFHAFYIFIRMPYLIKYENKFSNA